MVKDKEHVLFGGDKTWKASDWTASDDRVRGGKSQSYLEISGTTARFHGHLDIETLGGAGFASQRTVAEDCTWDVSHYDGILLNLGKSDGKRYTFIMKDELLPQNPDNGREQATISWEYDFVVSVNAAQAESSFVYIPWKDLKPTYRGKEKKGVKDFDTKNVKRFSLMMRSFFGDQHGDFSLSVKSIKAVSRSKDLEKGPTESGKTATLRAPLLMSLLAAGILVYGLCAYVCPWVMNTHTRHWGW
ncbi:hypothetical protein DPSP01_000193 [Paraphaeosphaeria sporulosa]|uniref:CIA30-domain-containing protein n=1 Tax=Paraphaeosphaeria sporulosa TaxID=1460663 RepID=A0A177CZB4_9PLEO|nr:CIA30-domain-containing protein [Paraphaeosphaeria sporulosa]OAG12875.1 CIA30-domain-containing protein [Paraphaeosphaeria sporulosa]